MPLLRAGELRVLERIKLFPGKLKLSWYDGVLALLGSNSPLKSWIPEINHRARNHRILGHKSITGLRWCLRRSCDGWPAGHRKAVAVAYGRTAW